MSEKDFDHIARVEKAIAEKYGDEAVSNPRSKWDEKKEKEYLQQMQELYSKHRKNEVSQQKIEINGIKVSKKLLNREHLRSCPVCGKFPRKSLDDVCLLKFDCCNDCYIKYVEEDGTGREQKWLKGWRPSENKQTKT